MTTTTIHAPTRTVPAEPLPRSAGGRSEDTRTLRGFAWWRVASDGTLVSYPEVRWEPGWNEASCRLYPRFFRSRWRRLHPIGVPGAFCLCGFHGSYRPQPAGPGPRLSARMHSGADGMVFGAVEGAGARVADGREWRAEFARPRSVYVPAGHLATNESLFARVAERYGIPIMSDFDALTGAWTMADERATRSRIA